MYLLKAVNLIPWLGRPHLQWCLNDWRCFFFLVCVFGKNLSICILSYHVCLILPVLIRTSGGYLIEPLAQAGLSKPGFLGLNLNGFWISLSEGSTAFLGNLYLLILTVKKVFPDVQMETPVFQFVLLASSYFTGLYRKMCPVSLHTPGGVHICL